MDINTILLIAAALLPAGILCVYIFKKDRVEKEPISLLIKLLLLGALCCFPAAYIEDIIITAIEGMFSQSIIIGENGQQLLPANLFYIYNFLKYFIGVALVEEGMKYIVLIYATKKNKEFNSLFDGLIYAIFVSLGFAAFENIFYVLDYGFGNALMRGILSVPGHMFFAVMMGYYYSLWHITDKAGEMELYFKANGLISASASEFSSSKYKRLSLIVPVIAHGIYDYCCTLDTAFATIVFYAFIIFMYIYCFRKIKKMSAWDSYSHNYAKALMMRKYPELTEDINLHF